MINDHGTITKHLGHQPTVHERTYDDRHSDSGVRLLANPADREAIHPHMLLAVLAYTLLAPSKLTNERLHSTCAYTQRMPMHAMHTGRPMPDAP